MSMKEEHLQKLLAEYTVDKYEQNRIYIQKQEDQNKFKVVYNPVTATTVTYILTKEEILKYLDFIDKVIDGLKDREYHVVESDTEKDGYVIPGSHFKKNKKLHKNKHKSPKKTTKKRSKLPKKTPKKSLKRVQRKH